MNHIDNRIDALMKKCKLDLEAQVIICLFFKYYYFDVDALWFKFKKIFDKKMNLIYLLIKITT